MRATKNRISVLKIEPEIQNAVKGQGLNKTILEKKAIETGSRTVSKQQFNAVLSYFNS